MKLIKVQPVVTHCDRSKRFGDLMAPMNSPELVPWQFARAYSRCTCPPRSRQHRYDSPRMATGGASG